MKINPSRAIACAAVLSVGCQAAADATAQVGGVTTYGQDPVPNSRFYDGPIPLGYGVDKVPSNSQSDNASDTLYGMDEIPRTRFYSREHDASPVLVNPTEQVLTGAVEGAERDAAPDRNGAGE